MKDCIYKLYFLLTAIAALHAVSGHAQQAVSTVIPEDSTAAAMNDTFSLRLHSAHETERLQQYRTAVGLYEAALDDLREYNCYRLEQMAAHAEETFHTARKEEQVLFLRDMLHMKRIQNVLLIVLGVVIALALIILILLLSYRLRSIRQRAAQEESKAEITRLEKERKELETKWQEMEAVKIRKELLAESLLVDYKNKLINDVQELINENPALGLYKKELTDILNPGGSVPAYMPHPTGTIREVHPQLFSTLQEKAGNRLTDLDLEYCRMIYLKMTSKEMAEILQVDPKTIRVTKYRLKKKLGLDREVNLNDFIEGMG